MPGCEASNNPPAPTAFTKAAETHIVNEARKTTGARTGGDATNNTATAATVTKASNTPKGGAFG